MRVVGVRLGWWGGVCCTPSWHLVIWGFGVGLIELSDISDLGFRQQENSPDAVLSTAQVALRVARSCTECWGNNNREWNSLLSNDSKLLGQDGVGLACPVLQVPGTPYRVPSRMAARGHSLGELDPFKSRDGWIWIGGWMNGFIWFEVGLQRPGFDPHILEPC